MAALPMIEFARPLSYSYPADRATPASAERNQRAKRLKPFLHMSFRREAPDCPTRPRKCLDAASPRFTVQEHEKALSPHRARKSGRPSCRIDQARGPQIREKRASKTGAGRIRTMGFRVQSRNRASIRREQESARCGNRDRCSRRCWNGSGLC